MLFAWVQEHEASTEQVFRHAAGPVLLDGLLPGVVGDARDEGPGDDIVNRLPNSQRVVRCIVLGLCVGVSVFCFTSIQHGLRIAILAALGAWTSSSAAFYGLSYF